MAGAHEQLERAEHAEHAAHGGHRDASNRRIALLIAILALFLAIAETLGKGAQTEALSYNVEASNLWAFFQAKTIRQTAVRTAAETVELTRPQVTDPAVAETIAKRLDAWGKTVARWESEPGENGKPGEGRRELSARAAEAEKKRDTALARYHHYEVASAAFQIGIVLASATVITGAIVLAFVAIGVGAVGLVFAGIGLVAPHSVHLF
jgi:small-conductance mechanosensitive channel